MNIEERGVSFQCAGCWLYGVLSLPAAMPASARGVVLVVGGPQYRVGSHRQFTLLARELAAQGVPVLRFDYRGMGDSEGELRDFADVEPDLRAAIDAFFAEVPGTTEVVLWGLCDAASAAMFYAHQDRRVTGMVLLNPWARTEEGAARAYLRHYYLKRLFDPGLWKKIAAGRFKPAAALRSFRGLLGKAAGGNAASSQPAEAAQAASQALPQRMLEGYSRFRGRTLFITSGADLTAREFEALAAGREWRRAMRGRQVARERLPDADHTFSRTEWRDQVARWTADWLQRW
ncbi:hydrolase 1, exosortase A system-associated [Noviherbaspirillum sp. 1P10PC]|uniref:hydrolase 1, exosortase A system-associated n=1 Tax=Noviherbaspirillum sp. 1P10PC TaxID=3132292 RepID=UPI0039A0613A